MKILFRFLLVIPSFLFFSCEKVIDPSLQNANPVLVVEAWLNDQSEKQVVQLTMTQPYFDSSTPTGVSGAAVTLTDDLNNTFSFTDDGSNTGTYQWVPAVGETIGSVGRKYKLTVLVNGETFEATSQMNRTTPVDSITFKIQPDLQYPDGSYIGQFWATDPKGAGDVYWIRTYKNGSALNKPAELNIAYDAGFSAGGDFDGATFIPPIRQGMNPIDKDPKNNNKLLPPYVPGDSVYVEIQSLTLEAFNHLQQVAVQTQRNGGFGALFSKPLANVSCNIYNTNTKGSSVVGFFNVSAVKGLGKKFVQ